MSLLHALHVRFYDLIVSNELFNRIVWGNSKANYTNFIKQALDSLPAGSTVVDVPCGPLTFSAKIYAADNAHKIYLLDISKPALKLAQKRLKKLGASDKIAIQQADAFSLNFADNSIDAVLSLGFLHIFSDKEQIIKVLGEFRRILKPDGRLYLQILVSDRRVSLIFQKFLHIVGQIGKPRRSSFYIDLVKTANFQIISSQTIGAMLYIQAQKQ